MNPPSNLSVFLLPTHTFIVKPQLTIHSQKAGFQTPPAKEWVVANQSVNMFLGFTIMAFIPLIWGLVGCGACAAIHISSL